MAGRKDAARGKARTRGPKGRKKPSAAPVPLEMDHLFLPTRDFAGSWKFWTDLMGLKGESKWGSPEYAGSIKFGRGSIVIAQGEEGFYEELGYTSEVGKPQLYVRTRDLEALVARLKARGAKVVREPLTTHYGARCASVEGPDGMVIALVEAK